jgi:hypothetical protein
MPKWGVGSFGTPERVAKVVTHLNAQGFKAVAGSGNTANTVYVQSHNPKRASEARGNLVKSGF